MIGAPLLLLLSLKKKMIACKKLEGETTPSGIFLKEESLVQVFKKYTKTAGKKEQSKMQSNDDAVVILTCLSE
jgi:hypothetical protein